MTTKTELPQTGEFIVSEANGTRARDKIVVVSGAGKLRAGTVLGRITASGKYNILAPGASTGVEVARAVLYAAVDATSADTPATGLVRAAEINGGELTWPAGITPEQRTAAVAQLVATGLIVR